MPSNIRTAQLQFAYDGTRNLIVATLVYHRRIQGNIYALNQRLDLDFPPEKFLEAVETWQPLLQQVIAKASISWNGSRLATCRLPNCGSRCSRNWRTS